MSKAIKKYAMKDYTLKYYVKTIQDKPRAVICGIRDLSENFKNNGRLVIPAKIDKYDVYSVDCNAFMAKWPVRDIIIENGVKVIGSNAFSRCDLLKTVSIPESVTLIGDFAFTCCPNLKRVTLSEGLEVIEAGAFEYTGLEEINLPNSLIRIGDGAFRETCIRSVNIGPNINIIGSSAFATCDKLERVNFSEGVRFIEDYAFKECFSLESITFPKSLLEMGYGVIDNCNSLKTIDIGPNTVILNPKSDFAYGCFRLEKINISPLNKNLKVIDDILYDTNEKTLIRVSPSIKNKNIKIPNWVKYFSDFCFMGVQPDTITIKSQNIDNLDNSDFNCTKIKCPPGSKIEEKLKRRFGDRVQISSLQSEIDDFFNSITDSDKHI